MNKATFLLFLLLFISCDESASIKINKKPTFKAISDTIIKVGIEYNNSIIVTDSESDSIDLSLTDGPDWLHLNVNLLSGTANQVGEHFVKLVANDGKNVVNHEFTIKVSENLAPTVSNLENLIQMNVNKTKTVHFDLSDPENEDLEIEITNKPSFVILDKEALSFKISPTYNDLGIHKIKMHITDATNSIYEEIDVAVYNTFKKDYSFDNILNLIETEEDGLIINSSIPNDFSNIIKFDKLGKLLWETTITNYDNKSNMIELENGDIIITSHSFQDNEILYSLDKDGNINWLEENFIDYSFTNISFMTAVGNSEFLFAYHDYINPRNFTYFQKRNANNEILWTQTDTVIIHNGATFIPQFSYSYQDKYYYYGNFGSEDALKIFDLNGTILDTIIREDNYYHNGLSPIRYFPEKNEFIIDYRIDSYHSKVKVFDMIEGDILREITPEVSSAYNKVISYLEYQGYSYQIISEFDNGIVNCYLVKKDLQSQNVNKLKIMESDKGIFSAYLNVNNGQLIAVLYQLEKTTLVNMTLDAEVFE